MDYSKVIVGALMLAFGVASGILRFVRPSVFKKLEPMKETYGAASGNIIHFVAYVIIPLLVGGWILGRGLGLF
jgi:hypothetical protein